MPYVAAPSTPWTTLLSRIDEELRAAFSDAQEAGDFWDDFLEDSENWHAGPPAVVVWARDRVVTAVRFSSMNRWERMRDRFVIRQSAVMPADRTFAYRAPDGSTITCTFVESLGRRRRAE